MAPHSSADLEPVGLSDTQAVVVPTSSSINDSVAQRRAKAGKLIAGVAFAATSDNFKAPVSITNALSDGVTLTEPAVCWKTQGEKMGP